METITHGDFVDGLILIVNPAALAESRTYWLEQAAWDISLYVNVHVF